MLIRRVRDSALTLGAVLGPFEAWLLLRGLTPVLSPISADGRGGDRPALLGQAVQHLRRQHLEGAHQFAAHGGVEVFPLEAEGQFGRLRERRRSIGAEEA